MTPAQEYLLEYLEEEFGRIPEIRVQVRKQDSEDGVLVRSGSREWFFPFEWSNGEGFKRVHQQVNQIRELYS